MDKTITTALMIVISMVTAMMLFNAVYPAVMEGGDAIASMANRTDEQLRSHINIIHSAGELDASGWWQDTNSNGDFDVFIWVKNTGDTRIIALERLDVFFGQEGNFARIPHESQAAGSYPYWTATIENSPEWVPTATLKISIHYQIPLGSARYFMKVVSPAGISAESFMGL